MEQTQYYWAQVQRSSSLRQTVATIMAPKTISCLSIYFSGTNGGKRAKHTKRTDTQKEHTYLTISRVGLLIIIIPFRLMAFDVSDIILLL